MLSDLWNDEDQCQGSGKGSINWPFGYVEECSSVAWSAYDAAILRDFTEATGGIAVGRGGGASEEREEFGSGLMGALLVVQQAGVNSCQHTDNWLHQTQGTAERRTINEHCERNVTQAVRGQRQRVKRRARQAAR